MIYGLYTAVLTVLVLLYIPVALARRVLRGVPLNLRGRLGLGGQKRGGPSGWVHAVSVGEAIAAAPLVEGLRRMFPELPLVMTTVTETGARVVRERFRGIVTHRFFPLDLPPAVRRFVGGIDPVFLVCMETELWPNVLRLLGVRRVPVMIANGRLSDRSFRRYRLVRPLLKPVLANIRVLAMQSDEDARRVIALGASPERVVVTGNMKAEALPDSPGAADLWHRLLGLDPEERVWIAGSTHRGEEEAVLEAHRVLAREVRHLVLVIAPRHPERVPEVLDLLATRGWPSVRRSELPQRRRDGAVIVLDTVGELAQLYSIADVVFVGGSLVAAGGHNMLEPALRRKPVLLGPHTENFRESAALLVASGAARVVRDAAELAGEVGRLLSDGDLRAKLGNAGYEAVASRHGAVQETLNLVGRFLYPGRSR
ncbi:MAG: 3-deoxy-D-manno-octulosonic acid transferase [Candidatus Rokubacteria bacterium]|nr:3-deoxy-D-manno-octulosonic acid transferase [Candidatus Rokubacteria bacterium]